MPFFGAFDFFVCLIEKRVEVYEYFQHYLDGLFGWFEKSLDKSRILDDFKTFQTVSKVFFSREIQEGLRLRSTSQDSQQARSDSLTD